MKLDPIAIANGARKCQGNFPVTRGCLDRVPDFDRVTAHRFPLAVYDHLRCIHAIKPKMLSVQPLSR
jgi:hypothetical protein